MVWCEIIFLRLIFYKDIMKFKQNFLLILMSLICLPIYAAQEAHVSSAMQDAFVSYILKGDISEVIDHLDMYQNDINYKNMAKETTLMLAIKSNSLPMFMEILCRTKKDKLEERDMSGQTALICVSKLDNENDNVQLFAELLLQQGVRVNARCYDL